MISIFVNTPTVRSPSGSTFVAALSASDVARSAFAAETARIIEFGLEIYSFTQCWIWLIISGFYPGKTFLTNPGKSTRVSGIMYGEYKRKLIGTVETALLLPVILSVSVTISAQISSNLVNFLFATC